MLKKYPPHVVWLLCYLQIFWGEKIIITAIIYTYRLTLLIVSKMLIILGTSSYVQLKRPNHGGINHTKQDQRKILVIGLFTCIYHFTNTQDLGCYAPSKG